MARLILLPYEPGNGGGYQKAVRADMERLGAGDDDVVVVYSDGSASAIPGALFIPRGKRRFIRRMMNMARFRAPAELLVSELRGAIQAQSFDSIFCGDVVLYRAARLLYPQLPMAVRFHNFFTMSRYRQGLRQYPIGPHLRYNLEAFFRLERDILQDTLVIPIFITEEEREYAALAFPSRRAECWPVAPQLGGDGRRITPPTASRLVFLGSLAPHTRAGLVYFLRRVFPKIVQENPAIQLHLYGGGTQAYHQPRHNVHGHGFFSGDGYPFGGDALFVVPDLLGGGIKIKVGDLLAAGVPFICTPFGAEGYPAAGDRNVMIVDIDEWPGHIAAYFQGADMACEAAEKHQER